MEQKNTVRMKEVEKIDYRKNHKPFDYVKMYCVLVFGCILRAFAVQVMLLPNKITIGGVFGISEIIYILTDGQWPVGFSLVLINIPIVIAALLMIGKRFAFRTAVSVLVIGVSTYCFDRFQVAELLNITAIGENLILYAIGGGAVIGVTLAMMFYSEASAGGADTITLLIQRRSGRANVGRIMVLVDIGIVAISGVILQSFDSFLYSVVTVFVSQIALELTQRGFASAVVYEIVTDKPQEMTIALEERLHRGVTAIEGKGMYQNTARTVLVCVVRRRQISTCKQLIKQVDPTAFAYSLGVMEVIGKGFRNIEI